MYRRTRSDLVSAGHLRRSLASLTDEPRNRLAGSLRVFPADCRLVRSTFRGAADFSSWVGSGCFRIQRGREIDEGDSRARLHRPDEVAKVKVFVVLDELKRTGRRAMTLFAYRPLIGHRDKERYFT